MRDITASESTKLKLRKKSGFIHEILTNKTLYLMTLPGVLLLLIFNYAPMVGIIIAFKDFRYDLGAFRSKWVGFRNFEFFLKTPDSWLITRNTVLYNIAFIVTGIVISVAFAVLLNELRNKFMAKAYQSLMILPFFLSWIIGGYLLFALLSMDKGFLNNTIFKLLGKEPIFWYSETKYWPGIILMANTWKYAGYNSIIYMAAITGIDNEMYEAAVIDGASKWQQITKITLPMLVPTICILVLMQLGRIINADFAMFFNLPLDNGALYPVTNVIDTYVYRALMFTRDFSLSTAAGLYQSVVGFTLVVVSNFIVKKINPERALF